MSLPSDFKRSSPNCFLTVTADAELVISVCRGEGFPIVPV